MKSIFCISISLVFGSIFSHAETKVTLSGVHLCCKGCVNGVTKAVKNTGATVKCNAKAGSVAISGAKNAVVAALKGVAKAGYYGKSSDKDLAITCEGGAEDKKVKSLTLGGAHLCCGKCVKAIARAVDATDGAKTHTAKKGSKTFEVTGDFNALAFIRALHDNGLHAVVK